MLRSFVVLIMGLSWLLFIHQGVAQTSYSITGTVVDSVNNQPLGFVTVIFNKVGTTGTTTNAFGKFDYKSNVPLQSLTCSFIGYNAKTVALNSAAKDQTITIKLVSSQYKLNAVTVYSGENPANRIVRGVLQHREENDPDKLDSYAYTAYNKFIYSGVPPALNKRNDTTGLYKFLEDHYFMILESVVETEFLKPNLKKEKVIGNKISGLQEPSFSLTNTQIQPLSFYSPFIYLINVDYVNPFGKGNTERYFFNIEDTLYQGIDTIFRLSFKPWKGRNFDGLKGIAEVNTNGYALQYIMAEPADSLTTLMKIRVEQTSQKINNERWFPTKSVSVVKFNNMMNNGFEVLMHGTTTLKDFKFNPDLNPRDLQGVQVEMLPNAGYRDDKFWETHRSDTLSIREQQTYSFLDSIGKKKKLDAKLRGIEGLIDGELRFKYVNINLSRFLWMNDIEGVRPGLGLRTNDRLIRNVSIGGFAGYGIKDEQWKYGGELRLRLYRHNDIYLKFNYWDDFEESGAVTFYKDADLFSSEIFRSFLVNSFDRVIRSQVDFTGRTFQFLHFDASAFMAEKHSTTDYRFVKTDAAEPYMDSVYRFTGVKLALRYAYKEKMVQALNNTFFVGTDYPILFFQVTQGFKGLLDGEFDYTKVEGKIYYEFPTKSFGDIRLQIAGGLVNANLPLSDLFAGRGSYQIVGLFSSNSFQTMRLNEFYSDQYVSVFYLQNLKTLLFRGKKFQPKPWLGFNMGFGTINNRTLHRFTESPDEQKYKTMEKGFYEAGLIIDDLISKEYLGVARIGVGVGAFYRIGSLEYVTGLTQLERTAFKIDFTIGF